MSESASNTGKASNPPSEIPAELPPEIALLLPSQDQRDVAVLTYRLFSDTKFRGDFSADPAGALVKAGYIADARMVQSLHRMDREVIDRLVADSKDISARSRALKLDAGQGPMMSIAAIALASAFLAGAVATHYLAHHFMEKSGRDI
jgi:hypothetical protein